MWGALTTSSPAGSSRAQEKSSRSLMLVDTAVRCNRSPICRAIAAKRWVNSSSWTASGLTILTSLRRGQPRSIAIAAAPPNPQLHQGLKVTTVSPKPSIATAARRLKATTVAVA